MCRLRVRLVGVGAVMTIVTASDNDQADEPEVSVSKSTVGVRMLGLMMF